VTASAILSVNTEASFPAERRFSVLTRRTSVVLLGTFRNSVFAAVTVWLDERAENAPDFAFY
jgi:hypothetical protein